MRRFDNDDGSLLTLGALGVLAVAGAVRRGSRAVNLDAIIDRVTGPPKESPWIPRGQHTRPSPCRRGQTRL